MKIVFMGTPDFAVASLKALVESGKEVVAVITAPDKPSGRGLVMNETPVKKYAVSKGIPVLQPEKLKNPEFLEQLRSYQADLQIVVAFRMLPEVVWNMPHLGTFNLHGSLLPQYRGAAPINWAVINGETETGVTTFFLQHEIDTGNIIFAEKTPILPDDNAGTIHDKLMEIGAGLVVKTVEAIEAGNYPQIPQDMSAELKSAPKIFKETCQINWNQPAEKVHNFIRGLSPYPAAWALLNDKSCKIYKTEIGEVTDDSLEIGSFKTDGKSFLDFKTADKYLKIKELQLEGKKRMGIEEFLRGFRA
ncbi:Methionyl-tRNA formyltransferase [Emticicia oligotrophica DSM 17448]|uniref:Methionyl-tRNA formyltransferase n=1 Tax=Emticicia oligotrophica (strain DSM 17448 / CIP 109782 / MTCC 6937 / GPTSA100-15) TaxID=929562 RepID=A0ABM5MYS8_EMTOG|nr:methionyl-tRNA formyltransferase [Emticicia oligotrophica]AFK02296.1 Methionyl-tRNA formyltransferase [Emticicia oligotrophica DSM 17448]